MARPKKKKPRTVLYDREILELPARSLSAQAAVIIKASVVLEARDSTPHDVVKLAITCRHLADKVLRDLKEPQLNGEELARALDIAYALGNEWHKLTVAASKRLPEIAHAHAGSRHGAKKSADERAADLAQKRELLKTEMVAYFVQMVRNGNEDQAVENALAKFRRIDTEDRNRPFVLA